MALNMAIIIKRRKYKMAKCKHFESGIDFDRKCGTSCDCSLGYFSDLRYDDAKEEFCSDCDDFSEEDDEDNDDEFEGLEDLFDIDFLKRYQRDS
jgi:hypothetical protein